MTEKYVLLIDLAKYLGINSDALTNRVKRSEIQSKLVRNPITGHEVYAINEKDAKKIIEAERNVPEIIKPEDLVLSDAKKEGE